jgi:hypothetical protein
MSCILGRVLSPVLAHVAGSLLPYLQMKTNYISVMLHCVAPRQRLPFKEYTHDVRTRYRTQTTAGRVHESSQYWWPASVSGQDPRKHVSRV